MQKERGAALRIGAWCVQPARGQISRDGETVRLEARTMRLLVCLAEHAGETVSIDDLLDQVWSGVAVTPDSVYQAVASLRRLLGDDPKQPAYIATVPRLGYRMVAEVAPWTEQTLARPAAAAGANQPSTATTETQPPVVRRRAAVVLASVTVALGVVASVWVFGLSQKRAEGQTTSAQPRKSIAVLPFLDLTDEMNHELFVDGMTEELVDKLSKIPDLRVPPARSSLSFKGKKATIGDVARALGTAYVLDGSVRKSGSALRVAAQLIRAESGFVVWSETYDRPSGDLVTIEDDIATAVAKSLTSAVDSGR